MDLGWELDNPAIALEKYYEDVDVFAQKKSSNEELQADLSAKQSMLNSQNAELGGLKGRLAVMGSYEQGNIDGDVQAVKDDAQKKVDGETKKYDAKQKEIEDKKERDIQENEAWLKNRLAQVVGDDADLSGEFTDVGKKALEFEAARRQFIKASNEKIKDYEDAISEEQLDCQIVVGELKGKQDAIYANYEPDIAKLKKQVEEINKKFQPDIRECQNAVEEKCAKRDEEIAQLQNDINREKQLVNSEIEGYQREYKQVDKQYKEQIRMAKLQNKATTRMENSRSTKLNDINAQIDKANNRANRKILTINQKIEAAQSKHANYIEKAESKLNAVISNRDQELEGPTRACDSLVQDRDSQVAALQSRIDQREAECNSKISQNKTNIDDERKAQTDENSSIDQQIVEYVMSGENCLSDVLNEQNAPFAALQGRVATWMEMIAKIKKGKMPDKYPKEHQKQKKILEAKDYSELQVELAEAARYNDKLSVFSNNSGILIAIGAVIAALGVVLAVIMHVVFERSAAMAVVLLAVGIAVAVLTSVNSRKEFSRLCRYVSLASDYMEFPGVTSHSTKIAQERELARIKEMGSKLYDVHYGKIEAQNIHDEKNSEILNDYERSLKLAQKELENNKAQIERERDNRIRTIYENAAASEASFNSEVEDLQSQIQILTSKSEALASRIRELREEIEANDQFLEAFESVYSAFQKQLGQNWSTPTDYTHYKLSNSLYIFHENGVLDDYGHVKMYKIEHNKKAIIINYDTSNASDGSVDKINKIIRDLMFDLMYAVHHVNSKGTYAQYVVDEMAATNELKDSNVKNSCNIKDIVGKIEDIKGRIREFSMQREKLAGKGTTIDALNENRFNSQERPEAYNILYIIFKPDERRNKLDDDLRMLITDCDKYGFLPIFICDRDTWERELQERDSIYKDIKSLTDNRIVVFDGEVYKEAF